MSFDGQKAYLTSKGKATFFDVKESRLYYHHRDNKNGDKVFRCHKTALCSGVWVVIKDGEVAERSKKDHTSELCIVSPNAYINLQARHMKLWDEMCVNWLYCVLLHS